MKNKKVCPGCGGPHPGSGLLCPRCRPGKRCPVCGTKNHYSAYRCKSCGRRFGVGSV